MYLASSEGFSGGYDGTYVYLYAVPVATDGQQLQTSYWVDYKRFLDELDSPEAVGKEAARRAVRMLGAAKVKSQKVPVVFDPMMAASFVAMIAGAANGRRHLQEVVVPRAASWARRWRASRVTIVDDGLLEATASPPARSTARACPPARTRIVDRGVLSAFLYDAFTARKAKTQSTGNAVARLPLAAAHRHQQPLPRAGHPQRPRSIVQEVPNGFYVTAMLGHGAQPRHRRVLPRRQRPVDRERRADPPGAGGHRRAATCSRCSTASTRWASDLEFRGSHAAPTLRFKELTVSGE